ncbi:dihydroxyacetone kinase phosphoryl donor subunit DhaM [Ornithinimicrobium sp. INDO-MA30-4]|uniref:dihydroxyacetone kinase phosphoryl donor subunit DhaM n=1 Tax=Ornithinimicrobium sp. INDO-MA30-4 TaxID=2908651 RepID=UPI001F305C07|nr:dihydroxyacetone kinase phosphoryl donor subunit DhaM [Ornithinimicrobium sp. INDO-MA30-4]UJH70889.1 HPr family phosphocarrier protein [Ornithinimicrobium sp. INDO-MA30-4]
MIGIVLVSHSHALGHAAAALASEMVSADAAPVIEVAAGLDETTFGTDAAAISEAISRADDASQGAGVLVLLDLGSAILSTEMALEFVDPDIADRVKLTSAPLVEGLIAAVVTASTGADLATVASEAMNGALAKSDHLGDVETSAAQGDSAPESTSSSGSGETGSLVVVVDIPHGLHARPAARLVAAVNQLRPTTVSMTNATTGKGLSLVAALAPSPLWAHGRAMRSASTSRPRLRRPLIRPSRIFKRWPMRASVIDQPARPRLSNLPAPRLQPSHDRWAQASASP